MEEINKILNSALTDLDKKWKEERKKDKQIRKENKGLFLLYSDSYKSKFNNKIVKPQIITPYFLIKTIDNKFIYGSRTYNNKRELTTEEHKQYFKLLDKVKKANKNLNKFKDSLKV